MTEPRSNGRPEMWASPDDMQAAIEAYVKSPPEKTIHTKDGPIDVPVLTITGLCLHLGFCSRQSFYDYEKRDGFSYTIKRARTLIEHEYETMLQMGNTTGAIFALKNFGWTDKSEVELPPSEPLQVVITRATKPSA